MCMGREPRFDTMTRSERHDGEEKGGRVEREGGREGERERESVCVCGG
jgi:hypothetical protein